MINVSKYNISGRMLARTTVKTLAEAHSFLDQMDELGNQRLPSKAVTMPDRPMFNEPFHDQDVDSNSDVESGRLTNLPHGE